MRAVCPNYNYNEEIRYENKMKNNENHKNDIFRIIIDDDCNDNGKLYYVINA